MAIAEQPLLETPSLRKFTVDEAIRMSDAGILGEAERVELIDGVFVELSPEGLDHPAIITELNMRLARTYPEGYWVRVQSTLPLDTYTYVLPDLVVSRINTRKRSPTAPDVVLAIEVAVSSRSWDLGRKSRIYAGWGTTEYWVVDVTREVVVVHTDPTPDGYRTVRPCGRDERLRLPELDAFVTLAKILDF